MDGGGICWGGESRSGEITLEAVTVHEERKEAGLDLEAVVEMLRNNQTQDIWRENGRTCERIERGRYS